MGQRIQDSRAQLLANSVLVTASALFNNTSPVQNEIDYVAQRAQNFPGRGASVKIKTSAAAQFNGAQPARCVSVPEKRLTVTAGDCRTGKAEERHYILNNSLRSLRNGPRAEQDAPELLQPFHLLPRANRFVGPAPRPD